MSKYKPGKWEVAYPYTEGILHRNNLVTSFPKAGRTWIILFFKHYDKNSGNKTSISTTHHTKNISYKKNLLLIRNPCDVLVSLYFHKKFRIGKKLPGFGEFIRVWLPVFNKSHKEWSEYKENKIVVRYEDLFEPKTWEKILEHFDIPMDRKAFDIAIEKTKFKYIRDNLRGTKKFHNYWRFLAMEKGQYTLNPKDDNAHKFRRGKPGGYVDYLSKEDIKFVRDNFNFGEGLEDHTEYYKGVLSETI